MKLAAYRFNRDSDTCKKRLPTFGQAELSILDSKRNIMVVVLSSPSPLFGGRMDKSIWLSVLNHCLFGGVGKFHKDVVHLLLPLSWMLGGDGLSPCWWTTTLLNHCPRSIKLLAWMWG